MFTQLLRMAAGDHALTQQRYHAGLIRQAPHLYRVGDGLPATKPEASRLITADRHHLLVDPVSQALIEEDFPFAEMAPGLQGAKIQEPEVNRFLQLVDPRSRKEYGRDMSLPAFQGSCRVRVKVRPSHSAAELFKDRRGLHGHSLRGVIWCVRCRRRHCGCEWIRSFRHLPQTR